MTKKNSPGICSRTDLKMFQSALDETGGDTGRGYGRRYRRGGGGGGGADVRRDVWLREAVCGGGADVRRDAWLREAVCGDTQNIVCNILHAVFLTKKEVGCLEVHCG